MITTRKAYAENDKLLATLNEVNERVIKDPSKTYLVWKGDKFPNGTNATFKAPAGCTIDWGDGNVETFETASTAVNTHTYTDGFEYHLISLSNYTVVDSASFNYCSGLTSVTIGNSVTSISNNAFRGCSSLTSVTIGNSVTYIGGNAFFGCSGLTSVTIGNSVTSISNNAFRACSGLTSIIIPDSVTFIDIGAFSGYSGLKTVKISAINPPTIDYSTFSETSLEKIIVPKSSIDTYKSAAIWSTYADKIVYEVDSSDLVSLEAKLNENIVKDPSKTYLVWEGNQFPYLDSATFSAPAGCTIDWGDGNVETFETESTEVTTHTYTDGIEYHLISLSNYTVFSDNAFKNCYCLRGLTISDRVTSIGKSAFKDCGFTDVTILNINRLTSIGDGAFFGCNKLANITTLNNTTSIGKSAFSECTQLKSVTIGYSVTEIGGRAFHAVVSGPKIIKVLPKDPPALGSDVFNKSNIEKIIVPKSAINTYKSAAGWSDYADKIVYEIDSSEYENTFWLSGGILIQPDTDLNTLTTIGNYYELDITGISNIPLGTFGAFTLKVSSVPDGSNFLIQQQFTQCNNGNTYTRVRKTDGSCESVGSALGSDGSGWSVAYNTVTAAIIDFTRKEAKALLDLPDEYDGPIIVPVKALIQCAMNHYSTRACLRVGGVGDTLETNPLYYGLQIEGLPVMDDFLVHIDIKSYNSDAWITLEQINKTYQCFYNSNYYAKTINGQPNPLYDARPKWIYVPRTGNRTQAVKYKEDADGNKTYTDVDGSISNTMPIPTGNIGSASKPIYMNNGVLTECDNVGVTIYSNTSTIDINLNTNTEIGQSPKGKKYEDIIAASFYLDNCHYETIAGGKYRPFSSGVGSDDKTFYFQGISPVGVTENIYISFAQVYIEVDNNSKIIFRVEKVVRYQISNGSAPSRITQSDPLQLSDINIYFK